VKKVCCFVVEHKSTNRTMEEARPAIFGFTMPPGTDPHSEADKNVTPNATHTESSTVELALEERMNDAFSEMRQAMEEFHLSTQDQINLINEKRRRSNSADFDPADQALKCRIDAINETASPSGGELELTSQNLQERIDSINQKTSKYFSFAGQVLQQRTNTSRTRKSNSNSKPPPNTPDPDGDANTPDPDNDALDWRVALANWKKPEEADCDSDGKQSPLLRGGESPMDVHHDVLILEQDWQINKNKSDVEPQSLWTDSWEAPHISVGSYGSTTSKSDEDTSTSDVEQPNKATTSKSDEDSSTSDAEQPNKATTSKSDEDTRTADAKQPNQFEREVQRRKKQAKKEYQQAKDDMKRNFKSWKKEWNSMGKKAKREAETAKQDLKRAFENAKKDMKKGLNEIKMAFKMR